MNKRVWTTLSRGATRQIFSGGDISGDGSAAGPQPSGELNPEPGTNRHPALVRRQPDDEICCGNWA